MTSFYFIYSEYKYKTISNLAGDIKESISRSSIECEGIPTPYEAREIVNKNQNLVAKIEIYTELNLQVKNSTSCPGKSVLEIYYSNNKNKRKIENLLDNSFDFFGIPIFYRNI